jgi:hypothetical protein
VTAAARRYFEGEPQPSSEEEDLAATPDYKELLKGLHKRIYLAEDSEEIAAEVVRFFEANPEVWAVPNQPNDFEELVELLRGRIRKEETVLFKLHEKLCPS